MTYQSLDKPAAAEIDAKTGRLSWSPAEAGHHTFVLKATRGETVSARAITLVVAEGRGSAVKAIRSVYNPKVRYTKASRQPCLDIDKEVARVIGSADDQAFWRTMREAQQRYGRLEVPTPKLGWCSVSYVNSPAYPRRRCA